MPENHTVRDVIHLVPVEEVLGIDARVFFLKIDVEGFELKVMRTLSKLLSKVRIPVGGREPITAPPSIPAPPEFTIFPCSKGEKERRKPYYQLVGQ